MSTSLRHEESIGEPVLRAQAVLGEGPLWDDSEKALWWVDVESGVLHCYSPDSGHDRRYEIGQRVSAVVRQKQGGLLLALQNGTAKFNPECGDFDFVCDPEADFAGFEVPPELGMADGMTIDTDDNLWVAFWGGWCLAQIDPRMGIVLRKISFPVANVTSCAFGGENLDELYVTTARLGIDNAALGKQPYAGDLFIVRPGAQGRPLATFRE